MKHSVIFEKWAEENDTFRLRAKAAAGAVLLHSGASVMAERLILGSVEQARKSGHATTIAECERRLGLLLWFQHRHQKAIQVYSISHRRFQDEGQIAEAAISLISRGVVFWRVGDRDNALADEERAVSMIGKKANEMPYFYLVAACLNLAGLHAASGSTGLALEKIENAQEIFRGIDSMEKARLLLRWIRALLLEVNGGVKRAGEMLERVERRMVDMEHERHAVLQIPHGWPKIVKKLFASPRTREDSSLLRILEVYSMS